MQKLCLLGFLALTACDPSGKITVGSVETAVLTAGQLYCSAPDSVKAPLGIVATGQTAAYVAAACAALGGSPIALPGGNVAIQIVAPPVVKG